MGQQTTDTLIGLSFGALAVGLMWVLPITVGILAFRRKGYSPHWMWFGVHPLGGYIAMIVGLCLTARKQCSTCGNMGDQGFRVCPYCGHGRFHDRRNGTPIPDLPLLQPMPPRQGI